ncbi:MAG: 23S rRNA (pseudouridine(1915)-N(3))-methyltransferase RlmH [Rikenellaceae bacterium]
MNIDLIVIGKTNMDFVEMGIKEYTKRLTRYVKFNIIVLPDIKNSAQMSKETLMKREGELFCAALEPYDWVVLMDENGKHMTSVEFSKWVQNRMNLSTRKLAFVIGGAYGFSEEVYKKASEKFSLSKMTFSHQMVRMIFTEQLYRAFTILRGEPYHHI